jgi:hypothetical protein
MPTISERLEALKALCDEATGVKWIAMNEHNARCIAASRTAMPALIAALEEILALQTPHMNNPPDPMATFHFEFGHTAALHNVREIIARHLEATDEQS